MSLPTIGNVLYLANLIECAVILCQGRALQEADIALADQTSPSTDPFPMLEESERSHILRALERTGWVLAGPNGAVELLSMSRSTLWSRI